MKILGIETSADDTGVALIEASGKFGTDFSFEILANVVDSQSDLHAKYGGIYPNLAKNKHKENLPRLLQQVLGGPDAPQIDAIAVTHGPGLEPCLWTGINFAQELSKKWNIPVVPVNHMEGHIIISALTSGNDAISNFKFQISNEIQFPMLSLLISGGHTELILSREWMRYEYIGRTRDDAVGEAFDKVARMLGLPYPGGPHISRLALEARSSKLEAHFKLPRPMIHEKNFDFSFSGLKTSVLRMVEAHSPLSDELKRQIAREFEDTAADVLISKTMRAAEEHGAKSIVIGGGVSANKHIRARFAEECEKAGILLLIPPQEFSTDNALMIALAGYFRAQRKEFPDAHSLSANGALKLDNTGN
ncbi:tRNA (adenosine(37)-N6)-threonylcarbamoyltransferase complex transferase subunit TsaD [Candidatus Kaiserbacteria bacterium]|nr:tRNA (adenosine(37)-N6)-threonylcarbamoyltransferase complex transferase subunit TsaD [Candidatus Kaiserbacteria bacterium]